VLRKRRIAKSPVERLTDCEIHLHFLRDARRLYPRERVRYKQIASELRVLVGDHRPARRLLIQLMKEFGFSFDIQPKREPIHGPIPMVGWLTDPETLALREEFRAATGNPDRLQAAVRRQAALARAVPIADFVEKGLAFHIAPYDYSYLDLVLAVAQQDGSSHEDDAIDEPLVRLRSLLINGRAAHIVSLVNLADLVLDVGSRFLLFVAHHHAYTTKYNWLASRERGSF
jgi:hypothetical protein